MKTVLGKSVSRREALLLSAAAGAVGVTLASSSQGLSATVEAPPAIANKAARLSTPRSVVAATRYGKVRGYVDDGVHVFKGIPYGASTGGANRWLPAKPPEPWSGERSTLVYGPNSPQPPHWWNLEEASFLLQWDDWYNSEDMLRVNVWTPGLSGKRPVMVYLHGGAFFFGSSHELPSQDGTRLALRHDVVSVTLGHRLNALGFLDVAELGGPDYADSANVGMTDLVFALEWVRDNIANFGGDPDNVMIYGQSGGGAKVLCLLGMPSAKGLFHRAGIQSEGAGSFKSAKEARTLASELFLELGLKAGDFAKLREIDWQTLNAAGNAAISRVYSSAPGSFGRLVKALPGIGWGPSVDGRLVPSRPFYDGAPEISRQIPLLIGSVTEEAFPVFMSFSETLTEDQWRDSLVRSFGGDKADGLIRAMKKLHPEKPITRLAAGVAGLASRNAIQRVIRQRHEQGGAPVYQYLFAWQSPQLDGRGGAWHTLDLAFCFDNTERCAQGTGNTPQARILAHQTARAWAAFARSGNPSTPELEWTPTDPQRMQTMVLDEHCRMENDPDADARKVLLG